MSPDEIERAKFLKFADLLDTCFPATHEHEKSGGENIRTLLEYSDRLASDLQATRAELERARSALGEIIAVRYGLDVTATDEERGDYWARLCNQFRRVARAALASMETGKG